MSAAAKPSPQKKNWKHMKRKCTKNPAAANNQPKPTSKNKNPPLILFSKTYPKPDTSEILKTIGFYFLAAKIFTQSERQIQPI